MIFLLFHNAQHICDKWQLHSTLHSLLSDLAYLIDIDIVYWTDIDIAYLIDIDLAYMVNLNIAY